MSKVSKLYIEKGYFFQFYAVQKADLEILNWKRYGIIS